MDLTSNPATLACAECGETITDSGYLPATRGETDYEPLADDAVCDGCGFNELGMMGCAPELADVVEPGSADVLLYIRRTDDRLEVLSAKE